METKKISFGFKKTSKTNLLTNRTPLIKDKQVELIKCVENQTIRLVEEKQVEAPLVIPMKGNGKTSAALASLLKRRAVLLDEAEITVEAAPTSTSAQQNTTENLEERAARELLAEAKKQDTTEQTSNLVLPLTHPDKLPLEGAKESNLNDYDDIPVQHFGMAMLRGMGWTEPPAKKDNKTIDTTPKLRPKGMGLGAEQALKPKPLLVAPRANETLAIKKHAYVRILAGKQNEQYGQIVGFDDEAGRVIVRMAIGGAIEALNEFLCQPVTHKEYTEYGKCINTKKFKAYKKLEQSQAQ